MIIIQEHNPVWKQTFQALKTIYKTHLGGLIIEVEHVGSTAVGGLWAKPIIDIDIVTDSHKVIPKIIEKLTELGYTYEGEMGIPDRFSFRQNDNFTPHTEGGIFWEKHNLYVCPVYSLGFKNHLLIRDYLRENPNVAKEYSNLKKKLVAQNPTDKELYTEGKTDFILSILEKAGLTEAERAVIFAQNKSS